ncbi:hypothetical protein ACFQX8_07445 [Klenkia terrae]
MSLLWHMRPVEGQEHPNPVEGELCGVNSTSAAADCSLADETP